MIRKLLHRIIGTLAVITVTLGGVSAPIRFNTINRARKARALPVVPGGEVPDNGRWRDGHGVAA
jgi:hypothetical protein